MGKYIYTVFRRDLNDKLQVEAQCETLEGAQDYIRSKQILEFKHSKHENVWECDIPEQEWTIQRVELKP